MRPEEYSPLNLAYLGDAVFELMVRETLVAGSSENVCGLFRRAKAYVCASAQSQSYFRLFDRLSPSEQRVAKRGRNSKPGGKAKNASVMEYQHATGLEALFGYLYLSGKSDRLKELFAMCVPTEVESNEKQ
ncbi:MAG: ribonuclease III [Clostridiales bacterium]|jgi:ribonuclease-3 family protein|nr:ribonuclease III [Clostridiales bacterium]